MVPEVQSEDNKVLTREVVGDDFCKQLNQLDVESSSLQLVTPLTDCNKYCLD